MFRKTFEQEVEYVLAPAFMSVFVLAKLQSILLPYLDCLCRPKQSMSSPDRCNERKWRCCRIDSRAGEVDQRRFDDLVAEYDS